MQGAIATPHHLASAAGREAYAQGGNAIDAALAAAAALTVVYPHQCALGGDLFALVKTPQGTFACNGSGAAPAGMTAAWLRQEYGQIPDYGVDAITTPGLVSGWDSLHSAGATLAWSDHFTRAKQYALDGVEVSSSLAAGIRYRQPALAQDPGCTALLLPGGAPLQEGETFYQPALAETLSVLAQQGAASFYRGDLAGKLVAGLQSLGSRLSADDFSAQQAELEEPLHYRFGELDLYTSKPNSQGFVLFEILSALTALNIPLDAAGENAKWLLKASMLAARDRDAYLVDPRHADIDLQRLMDPARLRASMGHLDEVSRGIPAHGDTVAVCTMDEQGYGVSLIQSVYQTFGSAVLEPSTGVIFHNRARGFSLDEGAVNEYRPGVRPPHSLMPLLVSRNQQLEASLGTMGGRAQPQILAQVLEGIVKQEPDLQQILRRPRWVVGARDIDFPRETVAVEADAPRILDSVLSLPDLDLARISACSESVGHAMAVRKNGNGQLEAAADPRSDGSGLLSE